MTNTKIQPELTKEQEMEICYVIDEWYIKWKNCITYDGNDHRFGYAKEELKQMICSGAEKE